MAYKGINRQRLNYLLSLGASDFELRKFFTDSRAQLIAAGARVQNLPASPQDRIRVIANNLPPGADDIVRAWFSKNITMVDPEPIEALVELYQLHEETGDEIPEDSAKRLARAALVHLFAESPSANFINFLRSSIGGQDSATDQTGTPATKPADPAVPADMSPGLCRAIINLVEGTDVDEHLDDVPALAGTFLTGVQAISKGQHHEAVVAIESLLSPELRTILEDYARRADAKKALGSSTLAGLAFAELPKFDGEFDYERDEVLAYCTNAGNPKAVFVQPLAVVRASGLQLLDEEIRRRIFPETGDVISFFGAGHPRQPMRGEIGVWRVAEHETQRATRFHLKSEKRPVYEVLQIPFAATDYDSVRDYLLNVAGQSVRGSHQPVIFQLADGLVIGARGDWTDIARPDVLDQGLFAWSSLPGIRFEGRIFVLGPLPKERVSYECGTIGQALRHLLRNVGGKLPGGVTRAQVRDLVQFLDSADQTTDVLRVQRLKSELNTLISNQDAIEALVTGLQSHPEVQNRIAELVKSEVAARAAQRTDLQAEIAKLQKQRDEWDERVRKQEKEHKKLRDETSNLVKAAFQKAKNESIATLADVAIFQALSGSTAPTVVGGSSPCLPDLVLHDVEADGDRTVAQILVSLGCGRRRAAAIDALGKAVLESGLILILNGVAARQVGRRWCASLGGGVLADATVGMIDPGPFADILSRTPAVPAIAVLDCNLSAVDIYGKPLHDVVVERLAGPELRHVPQVLMTLTTSVGALPYPPAFNRLSVHVDLDGRETISSVDRLEELHSVVTDADEGVLYTRLWHNAADRLKAGLDKLEDEARVLALSILAAGAN